MIHQEDTICAMATAAGGPIAIIRISGPQAVELTSPCWHSSKSLDQMPPRTLSLGIFSHDGQVIDTECIAVRMPAPHSYTGENVVELHCHGGAVCARAILKALLDCGIRHALPGEFSKRAFLNGKIDLTQAEAIMDMISAGSDAALRLANKQLSGAIGQSVNAIDDAINDILAEVESFLDFPEEEIDWNPADAVAAKIESALQQVRALAATKNQGEVLRGGVSLIIAGPPNVGKSSLLNLMLGRDRAIVSDIPGTTRDTIEANAQFNGIPFKLVDTAGVHSDTADAVEAAGVQRTELAAKDADLVIWLSDIRQPTPWPGWSIRGKLILAYNKADLAPPPVNGICISALTGNGMQQLYDAMENAILGTTTTNETDLAVAARHGALLEQVADELTHAIPLIRNETWELAAIHLRNAIAQLGEITGRTVTPDVLDRIFSKFCIGK